MTPSAGPGSPIKLFREPLVGSACPPVVPMAFSAVIIRGPGTLAAAIALRKATFTPEPPISRTVVNPASRVFFAF